VGSVALSGERNHRCHNIRHSGGLEIRVHVIEGFGKKMGALPMVQRISWRRESRHCCICPQADVVQGPTSAPTTHGVRSGKKEEPNDINSNHKIQIKIPKQQLRTHIIASHIMIVRFVGELI